MLLCLILLDLHFPPLKPQRRLIDFWMYSLLTAFLNCSNFNYPKCIGILGLFMKSLVMFACSTFQPGLRWCGWHLRIKDQVVLQELRQINLNARLILYTWAVSSELTWPRLYLNERKVFMLLRIWIFPNFCTAPVKITLMAGNYML